MVFGCDVFGWTNSLFNAEDKPTKGPSFKSFLNSDAIKENLGSGGRWADGNQALFLMDTEHLYAVLNPGWEATIRVRDFVSGSDITQTATIDAPVLNVEKVDGVVRLVSIKDPEGNSYEYA